MKKRDFLTAAVIYLLLAIGYGLGAAIHNGAKFLMGV